MKQWPTQLVRPSAPTNSRVRPTLRQADRRELSSAARGVVIEHLIRKGHMRVLPVPKLLTFRINGW